jgi:hypothetical protein
MTHPSKYKRICLKIFKSDDPNRIISEVEDIYPRFITFVFDVYRVAQ